MVLRLGWQPQSNEALWKRAMKMPTGCTSCGHKSNLAQTHLCKKLAQKRNETERHGARVRKANWQDLQYTGMQKAKTQVQVQYEKRRKEFLQQRGHCCALCLSPQSVPFSSSMHLLLELTLLSGLLEARRQFLGSCGQPWWCWNDHRWPLSFGS